MNSISDIEELLERWQSSILNYLPTVLVALVVLVLFYLIARLLRSWSLKSYSKLFKKQSEVVKVISLAIYVFFFLSGIFLALEILGLESVLTKLLAGAGIVGIVAGFAFKDIASNAFAGLLLNIQRPIKKENWVEIDNNFGTIENIGWITTSIKTVAGQEVFVPNQVIYNSTFTNYSTYGKRRVILKSGVSYGDDLDHVKKVALDEVQQIGSVMKSETIDFYFTGIGNSTYDFEVRFWIHFGHQRDYLHAMSELIQRIKRRFEEENISIAYSVTTLDFGVKGGVSLFDKPIELDTKK